MQARPRPFLTAEWRALAMLNYEVPLDWLAKRLPVGVEPDPYQGRMLVSMVGFLFLGTRVLGLAVPWHRNFEEVNLRCYVRRRTPDGWRRGVVFVRELVPRRMIAAVARTVYGEPYLSVPMWHRIDMDAAIPRRVEYGWTFRGQACQLGVTTCGDWRLPLAGEEAEFITEHYWGYTRRRGNRCGEYGVEHPPWRVLDTRDAWFSAPVEELYGPEWAPFLTGNPTSALLAEGSPIIVRKGAIL